MWWITGATMQPCAVTFSFSQLDSSLGVFCCAVEESDIIDLEKRYWLLKAQSRTGRFDLETFVPLVSPPIHASLSEGKSDAVCVEKQRLCLKVLPVAQACFTPSMRIGTITSTLKRSRADCRRAAGGPSPRGRNVSPEITTDRFHKQSRRSETSPLYPCHLKCLSFIHLVRIQSLLNAVLPRYRSLLMLTNGFSQSALRCLMWTTTGFCLGMNFTRWWWRCWKFGRTIGRTRCL